MFYSARVPCLKRSFHAVPRECVAEPALSAVPLPRCSRPAIPADPRRGRARTGAGRPHGGACAPRVRAARPALERNCSSNRIGVFHLAVICTCDWESHLNSLAARVPVNGLHFCRQCFLRAGDDRTGKRRCQNSLTMWRWEFYPDELEWLPMRKSHKTGKWRSVRSAILNIRSKLFLPRAAFPRKNADFGSAFMFAEYPVCSKPLLVCSGQWDQDDLSSTEQFDSRMWTSTDTIIAEIRSICFTCGKIKLLGVCWLWLCRLLVEKMWS